MELLLQTGQSQLECPKAQSWVQSYSTYIPKIYFFQPRQVSKLQRSLMTPLRLHPTVILVLHTEQHSDIWTNWRNGIQNGELSSTQIRQEVVRFSWGRTPPPQQLVMFDTVLNYQSSATYLGVELDRKVTFLPHIQNIHKHSVSRLLALYPMPKSPTLSLETRIHIYCIMVHTLLTYATPAWKHAAQTTNSTEPCCSYHYRTTVRYTH